MQHNKREQTLIIAAFAAIYLIWGSTYLINYFAIQDIPPFLMSGSRFVIAGALLFGFTLLRGHPWPSLVQWKYGLITGILFLTLGTGLVVWSVQIIDTGLAALFVAFEPLVVVLMVWGRRAQRPGWNSFLGVAVGILGMLLLVGQPRIVSDTQTWLGIGAITVAIVAWAFGSLYVAEVELPKSRMQASAMQMLGGGVTLLLAGWFFGEHNGFALANIGMRAWWSYLYLIFAGSILAFSAFNYLLVRVSPEKAATSNYVNPVVALLMGWAFNNEQITTQSILAAALLLSGVFFINSRFNTGRTRKIPLLK